MRVGTICRADNSGLGTLAREFYDNGIITNGIIVPNFVYKVFPKRFPNFKIDQDLRQSSIDTLLEESDVLLLFETPFRWDVLTQARERGIPTVLMVMHEGLPDINIRPDLYLAPSALEMRLGLENIVFLPVPVNTDRLEWTLRDSAHHFIHNTGHGGTRSRNGTVELIEALKYTDSDFLLTIRSQMHEFEVDDPRVESLHINAEDYWDIWADGDVFIFPEKFNGLSLPIQEALASGMMIMSTDHAPFNEWLPTEPLIPIVGEDEIRIMRNIKTAKLDPKDIAKKIDEWVGKDITRFSEFGRDWAENNSWKVLKPKYLELLSSVESLAKTART